MTDDSIDSMDTITPESMLTTLTWLPCASCGGVDDDTLYLDDGRTWTPKELRASCHSCQDADGTATGLMLPGLSEECPCLKIWNNYEVDNRYIERCGACCDVYYEQGFKERLRVPAHSDAMDEENRCTWFCVVRRIPSRHDVLLAVETALNSFGEWEYSYMIECSPKTPHAYILEWTSRKEYGEWVRDEFDRADRLEAAIAALYAALVAKGLVEETPVS